MNPSHPLNISMPTSSRPLHPTMGQGVAERTYLRQIVTDNQREELSGMMDEQGRLPINKEDPNLVPWLIALHNSHIEYTLAADAPHFASEPSTKWEQWHDVAHRVALGNVLAPTTRTDLVSPHNRINEHYDEGHAEDEYHSMSQAIAKGSLLMSGRHLQQGDDRQPTRDMAVFSNCAVSPTSYGLFQLLLNGAGVGRDYSDDMMVVDWAQFMPRVVSVLRIDHPDFIYGKHTSDRDARHLYKNAGDSIAVLHYKVEDSREGWARAVEYVETTTYRNQYDEQAKDIGVVVLDFSDVRSGGSPIFGMQGRPSSGPTPLMDALGKIDQIRGTGMKPWLATLYIDHYLAEPVLVGGARRSARMSTKNWRDEDALAFVDAKRPIEFVGRTMEDVRTVRADLAEKGAMKPTSFLWSSNNSLAVDADFWARVNGPISADPLTQHAKMVFQHVMECSYGDSTGEPAFINVDRINENLQGFDDKSWAYGQYYGSNSYQVMPHTEGLMRALFKRFSDMPYHFIVNPCGEICLCILGGFCVIADVVPFHCDTLEETEETVRIAARALIRTNTMDSVFRKEVTRTNRIGVGLTGIHEAAWKFFRVQFADLIAPDFKGYLARAYDMTSAASSAQPEIRAAAFWEWLGSLSTAVHDEAREYAAYMGVTAPHTDMTVKPSGTVSKLFGLTEGWHLPSMRQYIRWVQYHQDSPLLAQYVERGYPVRKLTTYRDHVIVGFPTEPTICSLEGIEDHIVTAAEASMEGQFTWLRMGEFFLMEGGSVRDYEDFMGAVDDFTDHRKSRHGGQISYTMKYNEGDTPFSLFRDTVLANLPNIRCVSVMPQTSAASYEYLPEEPVTAADFMKITEAIILDTDSLSEGVDRVHLECDGGACPIEFN